MKFQMIHENYNVADLKRSMDFYEKALGLKECRRKTAEDGSFIIVYLKNEESEEQSFCYFDWQHPFSAIDELADDEEDT